MTYEYKLDNFLSKPLNDDQRLFINNKNNIYVDSITTDISHYFIKNNCLVIKITNKNDLILSFDSKETAQQALLKLSEYRKIILEENGNATRTNYPTFNTLNRNMLGLAVTSDFELATNSVVQQKPLSRIEIIINGNIHIENGIPDGINIGCYFTSAVDAGDITKARVNDGDVQLGDQLYWIGTVAGFDIDDNDKIDFNYLI